MWLLKLKNKCLFFKRKKSTLPPCSFTPEKYLGKSYEDSKKLRSGSLVPCIKSLYKEPLLLHQGRMQWLFDYRGTRFLDMFGGIVTVSVGHCHPRIVEALQKQASQLWHTSSLYIQPRIQEYVEKLLSTFSGDLKVVYLVNSGSEANDLAILLARLATGNQDIIALRNCYHGGSQTCIGLNGQSIWKYPTTQPHIIHVLNPNVYAGKYGGCRDSPIQPSTGCPSNCEEGSEVCDAARLYIEDVKEAILYNTSKTGVAGFIAESIQGVGGTVQYPKGYLKGVYEIIRNHGGVCIADEVQTGFGRTGTHFWGFEGHGVQPDIVTMAKGIGNGFPLAAVVTTPDIAKNLERAAHFNTFGGNPLACAVGLEVLKVIEDEKLQQNCHEIGTYLLKQLSKLRDKHPIVGDVRGKGLMVGVEIVSDKTTKKPMDSTKVKEILEICRNNRLLIGVGGIYGNVFRIKPPMCITKEDADYTVDVIDEAISEWCS